ncbi:uncharacterized protein N0V89_006706 [Didymosphaeria variabile]|uniref:Uncharacterized protein n=1 Tax=Didymosphaeria variabile TaxID=1932322 RepID=A0A9W8XJI1_9PLEO|nr:uncharacterized protein N0V89_006706 [Didymosphaeria variabile]KAJ4351366.1 hypothetical protein N0V89_006706 [Didymosphaeria variabile]
MSLQQTFYNQLDLAFASMSSRQHPSRETERHSQVMQALDDFYHYHGLYYETCERGRNLVSRLDVLYVEYALIPRRDPARADHREQYMALRSELEALKEQARLHEAKLNECRARLKALGFSEDEWRSITEGRGIP